MELRAYGVMIALAFIAATWLGVREARRKGFDPELIYDLLFVVMLASVAGARLYFVIFSEPAYYFSHPFELAAIWKGGMSLHGGLLGGLLAGWWFTRKYRLGFWKFADTLTPSIMLGQAVGRLACVFNGCSYGKPAGIPWAITFTNQHAQAPLNVPLHPTQFYELGADLTLFALIWFLRTKTRFEGQLFLLYWISYGIVRLGLENFRGDSLLVAGVIPVPQLASAVIILLAGSLYITRRQTGAPPQATS